MPAWPRWRTTPPTSPVGSFVGDPIAVETRQLKMSHQMSMVEVTVLPSIVAMVDNEDEPKAVLLDAPISDLYPHEAGDMMKMSTRRWLSWRIWPNSWRSSSGPRPTSGVVATMTTTEARDDPDRR